MNMDIKGKKIILGSNSPRRKELLAGLNIEFTVDTGNTFEEVYDPATPHERIPEVLSEGKSGAHKIQGIGAGFIPENLNISVYDEVIAVSDDDAFNTGREIPRLEGILTGISSGAAVFAAISEAKKPENEGKSIVVLLTDTGERYLSSEMFSDL